MIIVFGSLNMDLLLPVAALPRPGETVLTAGYETKPGGKGANQAVAAARAGAPTSMVGCVGRDGFGDALVANLEANGVDAGAVARTGRPTGAAFICVEEGGENFIAVASGANLDAAASLIPGSRLGPGATVLLQMEVPAAESWAAIRRAAAAGARTVLNLAPAAPVPADVLGALDVLVVNELEAEALAGGLGLAADGRPEATARALASAGDLTCVVTLGAQGALAAGAGGLLRVGALPIEPVDTTGAGDAFTGVLAAALDAGLAWPEALRRASVGAALACLKLGAQESLPTEAEIERHLPRLAAPVAVA